MNGSIRKNALRTPEWGEGVEPKSNENTLSGERMAYIRSILDGIEVGRIGDTLILSIPESDLTLSETLALMADAQGRWPDHEIFLDGDARGVVARGRCSE